MKNATIKLTRKIYIFVIYDVIEMKNWSNYFSLEFFNIQYILRIVDFSWLKKYVHLSGSVHKLVSTNRRMHCIFSRVKAEFSVINFGELPVFNDYLNIELERNMWSLTSGKA